MIAVELQRSGPDGLVPVERPDPEPGPGQVRVDLVAAALNRRDWWIARGDDQPVPAVLGSDGAGVVSTLGDGVEDLTVGDQVVINPSLDWGPSEDAAGPEFRILGVPDQGTFAEQIVVAAHQVRPRPTNLTWIEAAALPLAGLTAWRAVVTHAEAGPGRTILVPGAGGGVATFAIQIGAALGARVVVTSSSPEKIARAEQLGAAAGVDYREDGWWEQLDAVDAVVDSVGPQVWPGALRALRPGGVLVSFGDTGGEEAAVEVATLFFGWLRIQGTTMGSPREFDALLAHVGQASWRPVIDRIYPLQDAGRAFERLDAPERQGKIVVVIDEQAADGG